MVLVKSSLHEMTYSPSEVISHLCDYSFLDIVILSLGPFDIIFSYLSKYTKFKFYNHIYLNIFIGVRVVIKINGQQKC